MILEKERGVTEDPRGVFLAADAVRILWDLGINDQFKDIGYGELTPRERTKYCSDSEAQQKLSQSTSTRLIFKSHPFCMSTGKPISSNKLFRMAYGTFSLDWVWLQACFDECD